MKRRRGRREKVCVFYKNDFVVVVSLVTMRKEVKVVIEKIEIWRERKKG